MSADDWFRNTTWNDSIAARFEGKLRRARRKAQYLRIQAGTLARTNPDVALELLDRYFALGDGFDHAQGYVDRATALVALGRLDDGLDSYELALGREAEFPNLKTEAYIQLPYLIATRCLAPHYERALEVLDQHRNRLTFPVDHFRWHAARALILAARGNTDTAHAHARQALEAASKDSSGFRFHPSVGLVSDAHREILQKLVHFRDA